MDNKFKDKKNTHRSYFQLGKSDGILGFLSGFSLSVREKR